jgi:hypothetical protein
MVAATEGEEGDNARQEKAEETSESPLFVRPIGIAYVVALKA